MDYFSLIYTEQVWDQVILFIYNQRSYKLIFEINYAQNARLYNTHLYTSCSIICVCQIFRARIPLYAYRLI